MFGARVGFHLTGTQFLTQQQMFVISLAFTMIGIVYWHDTSSHGVLPDSADTATKVASSVDTDIRQLIFGYLADLLGRKWIYGVELLIITPETLARSLVSSSPAAGSVGVLVFWQVVIGVRVGGDCP